MRPSLLGAAYLVALTVLTTRLGPAAPWPDDLAPLMTRGDAPVIEPDAGLGPQLIAIALAFGLLLGVSAELLVTLRATLTPPSPKPSMGRRCISSLLLIVSLHAAAVAYVIALQPQRFDEALYQPGGWRRLLIIVCADWLGPASIAIASLLAALLYTRVWRLARRWKQRAMVAALVALLGWHFASFVQGRSSISQRSTRSETPNVLLLVATSLPLEQLDAATAPALSSLALRAARFEQARVTNPEALPSLVTLLTGLYPHHHGIRTALSPALSMRAAHAPLARIFTRAGYATTLVGDVNASRARLLDLGFEHIDAPSPTVRESTRRNALSRTIPLLPALLSPLGRALIPAARTLTPDARDTAERTLTAIDAVADQPFFITSTFSDAEPPFDAPCERTSREQNTDYRGRFKFRFTTRPGAPALDTDDEQQVHALRSCVVRQMDRAISNVLDGLRERGLDRSTIVVVTSLHGTSPDEAGSSPLGEATLRVPLLITDGRSPHIQAIDAITRDIDVAPTLLTLANVAPPGDLDGVSLAPALHGANLTEQAAFAEAPTTSTRQDLPSRVRGLSSTPIEAVAEFDEARDVFELPEDAAGSVVMSWQRAIVSGGRKLVFTPTRLGPLTALFDARRDPANDKDLAANEPEVTTQLRSPLLRWILEDPNLDLRDGHVVARPANTWRALATGTTQGAEDPRPRRLLTALDDAHLTLPLDDRWLATPLGARAELSPAPTPMLSARARSLTRMVSLTSDVGGHGSRVDRRESLVVPGSSRITFSLTPSAGTRLDVAPALLSELGSPCSFSIEIRPQGGAWSTVDTIHLAQADAAHFHDRSVDLSSFADTPVDLALVTRAAGTEEALVTWGAPTLVETATKTTGENVLWISIDGMRPDVLSSWHTPERDAVLSRAPRAALDAWLPAMPTVAPNIEALAQTGASFIDTTSVATTAGSGTIAAMAGAKASELGLDTSPRVLPVTTLDHFRASRPALLPDLLRARGFITQRFQCAPSEELADRVEDGFDQIIERSRCSEEIIDEAAAWTHAHASERFFQHVRLDLSSWRGAMHPAAPALSLDSHTRVYLGALSGIDAALRRLLSALSEAGIERRTLVVLSAAHGETLSLAHDARIALMGESVTAMRGNAAASMFDETTRVPLIFSLPGRVTAGQKIDAPVQSSDVMPTVLELLGEPVPGHVRGRSLLPSLEGGPADLERAVVSEGRRARSIRVGKYRYIERDEGARALRLAGKAVQDVHEELYDLQGDPGEREDLSARMPEQVAKMREALANALASSTSFDVLESESLAGSRHQMRHPDAPARISIRFSGGATPRRFTFSARLESPQGAAHPPTLRASAYQVDEAMVRVEGLSIDAALTSTPSGLVGVDLEVWPSSAHMQWRMTLDDQPLTAEQIFAGSYGLRTPALLGGLRDAGALAAATSDGLAWVDARSEVGVFVSGTLTTNAQPLLPGGKTTQQSAHLAEQQAIDDGRQPLSSPRVHHKSW